MKKKNFALSKVYSLLEPGPVVMVTTAHKGETDVMALAWHTMIEFTPPMLGFVLSEQNHSFALLKASKQCGISIPTAELARAVVGIGTTTGGKIDKFEKFNLTKMPASQIQAPLVAECYANLECKVVDTKLVSKYNFFVLEVVKAWIDPSQKQPQTLHHCGHGEFIVDGERIKLPMRG